MTVGIWIESGATRSVYGAAFALGAPICAVVSDRSLAETVRLWDRVQTVIVVEEVHLWPESLAPIWESYAKTCSHWLVPDTPLARHTLGRLSMRMGIHAVTEVIALDAKSFQRTAYTGQVIELGCFHPGLSLVQIKDGVFSGGGRQMHAAELIQEAYPITPSMKQCMGIVGEKPSKLVEARCVVAGGMGIGSKKGFAELTEFAESIGAEMGATRAAIDAGFAPRSWQIGQTGRMISPDVYIGVALSGSIQHMAGIQNAKHIIAINTDAKAPIMKLADFSCVMDWREATKSWQTVVG